MSESEQTIVYTAQIEYRLGFIAQELESLRQSIDFMPRDINITHLWAIGLTLDNLQIYLTGLQTITRNKRRELIDNKGLPNG